MNTESNGEEITEHIDADETVDRTRKVRIDATAFDHSEVQLLRQKGFDWTQVSKLLGTNRKTLQRWRERTNYEDPFRGKGHYSETELNDIVSKFSDGHWEKGERMVIGHIRGSTDIRPIRSDIRKAVNTVDAEGKRLRKALFNTRLKRREYKKN